MSTVLSSCSSRFLCGALDRGARLSISGVMWPYFTIVDARDRIAQDAVAARAMDRIYLGMDIDEAIAILKSDGFIVDPKREEEDSLFDYRTMFKTEVHLDGKRDIPWHVTLRYVVDLPTGRRRPYLFIIASLDGRIVRIK